MCVCVSAVPILVCDGTVLMFLHTSVCLMLLAFANVHECRRVSCVSVHVFMNPSAEAR